MCISTVLTYEHTIVVQYSKRSTRVCGLLFGFLFKTNHFRTVVSAVWYSLSREFIFNLKTKCECPVVWIDSLEKDLYFVRKENCLKQEMHMYDPPNKNTFNSVEGMMMTPVWC